MNRNLLALCAIITVSGCAACNPEPINPCDPDPCGNATACSAKDGGFVCTCKTDFYPDPSGTCSLHFTPSSLASQVFCPADTGRLEISGQTGTNTVLNGYWVEILPNTFDRCVWVLLNPALGANLPSPDGGQLISQAKGLEIEAVDQKNPVLPDGNPNTVQPLKEVELMFKGHRGTVLLFKESDSRFENVPFSITADGSLGKTVHFSPFYLLNTAPAALAKATRKTGKTVEVDFTGTIDEGSSLSWGITHQIWENGTLLDQRVSTQYWEIDLPGGNHTLVLRARDPYGMEDSKTVSINVDLCTGNACLNWQTCREVDGVCVGTDPCLPNPCQHGGTCSPTGVGTTSCSCGNWTGTDCSVCPPGFYVDSLGNCVDDPCLPDPCNGHASACSNATGSAVCSCSAGFSSATCNVCAAGYIEYPTCRDNPCDPDPCAHGTCSTVNGSCGSCGNWTGTDCSVCPAGFYVNGAGNCVDDPCLPNVCLNGGTCTKPSGAAVCSCSNSWSGANCATCPAGSFINSLGNCVDDLCLPDPCNGHASACSNTTGSAVCSCSGNWTGPTCATCPAGFTGSDCHVDLCYGNTCSGHGTCNALNGVCGCDTGYDGAACNACATNFGPAYPACNPVPTISGLSIDCSSTGGICGAGGFVLYPVTFSVTNATTCAASAVNITGVGTSGSTSACVVGGNSGSFTYTTGSTGGTTIRITVTVTGPGGSTNSPPLDVTLE